MGVLSASLDREAAKRISMVQMWRACLDGRIVVSADEARGDVGTIRNAKIKSLEGPETSM